MTSSPKTSSAPPIAVSDRPVGRGLFRAAALTAPPVLVWSASQAANAAVPTVGKVQPPGTAGLLTILGWGGWIVGFIGVIGILVVAVMMILKHRRGEAGEAYGSLGAVLGGLVLATAASLIAGALYA